MNKKKRHVVSVAVIILIILSMILIVGVIFFVKREGHEARPAEVPRAVVTPKDSAAGGAGARTVAEMVRQDTALNVKKQKKTPRRPAAIETARGQERGVVHRAAEEESNALSDSGGKIPEVEETDTADAAAGECEGDTVAPWVYTDPSGGLHHAAISVKLFATKPCAIEWKTDGAAPWNVYKGETIRIEKTTTLLLQASDSCGNIMEPREELYDVRPDDSAHFCPDDMEHVLVGQTSFCIDRYEWPNRKGRLPRSYISVYQAMDTCVSVGKRLCTSDEWTIACTGPYGWKYAYGPKYEIYACVTNDTTVRPSGIKPECRGYFGVYDMSGNCAEWTSTRSSSNMHFYNVMGGFWESGPQSGCFDIRYSYFPQNRHNPVGFRCCKDARSAGTQRGAK